MIFDTRIVYSAHYVDESYNRILQLVQFQLTFLASKISSLLFGHSLESVDLWGLWLTGDIPMLCDKLVYFSLLLSAILGPNLAWNCAWQIYCTFEVRSNNLFKSVVHVLADMSNQILT